MYLPDEERYGREFPAQITMSLTAILAVLACWAISQGPTASHVPENSPSESMAP